MFEKFYCKIFPGLHRMITIKEIEAQVNRNIEESKKLNHEVHNLVAKLDNEDSFFAMIKQKRGADNGF